MSHSPNNQEKDLEQLRDILFGDQALQTEERFDGLDRAISSLRRETRQLRHALTVEAEARVAADNSQNTGLNNYIDTSFSDLSTILIDYLANEKQKRAAQFNLLSETLNAYQKSQDDVTTQLIAHLQNEQKQRNAQFAQLQSALTADQSSQDEVVDSLSGLLTQYRSSYISENGYEETESAASINSRQTASINSGQAETAQPVA